jgi:hypothetical protein
LLQYGRALCGGTILAPPAVVAWFRVSSKRLRYRGRLSPEPYAAWARSNEGATAIEARAREDRLYILPRTRARRRIWRELRLAARGERLRAAMQSETDHFATALIDASHASGLPRRTIELHRLVVVPCTLVAARARTTLRRRLFNSEALASLDPRVRDFLCEQVVIELDAAVVEGRPSLSRPLLTHDDTWACIGLNTGYQWIDPMFSGPGWIGHYLMFEFPRAGLSRKARKELERAVHELEASLANISRFQRDAIMQVAVDGLPRLSVTAAAS